MGMYTELIFGATLKEDTPKDVIDTLQYMVNDTEKPTNLAFEQFRNPLSGGSCYFAINSSVSKMWLDSIDNQWHISTRANIKNYESEIEKFLEWIEPYLEQGSGRNEMYAIVMYEEATEPKIYYLKDDDDE